MSSRLRPSDGRVSKGAAVDLNVKGFRIGDRVIYRLLRHQAGDITGRHGSGPFIIGRCQPIDVREILGRVPAGMTAEREAQLCASLDIAEADRERARREAWQKWERAQSALLKAFNVK